MIFVLDSNYSFIFGESKIFEDVVVKRKPCSGSLALRQLNPNQKKRARNISFVIIQNVVTMIVWEIVMCSLRFEQKFQFMKTALFLFKKVVLSKKRPPAKVESFPVSFLNLNQWWERVFTENC